MNSTGEVQANTECARKRLKWSCVTVGMASLLWLLVRVIPKPSRAAYPCQRAAAPLASWFVVWVAGLVGAHVLNRNARRLLRGSRYFVAAAALVLAVYAVWLPLGVTYDATAQTAQALPPPFSPSEGPNKPMGVGKGIHPGRVVWVHEPDATSWDGKTGNWWDEGNIDQSIVDRMVSQALQSVTGDKTDKKAWTSLFRSFNQSHDAGKVGYRPGEKVVVKLNMNQDRSTAWRTAAAMPSPHMVYALVNQLVKVAGVRGQDITLYDASRYIGDPIYNKIRSNRDPNFQAVRFVVSPTNAGNGRVEATADRANPIHFAQPGIPTAYFPQSLTEAKYLINVSLFRGHTMLGVTLTAKNHFGSTYFPDNGGWTPRPLHECSARDRSMGSYNCLVDLIGHKQTSGKTLLYMVDGLYGAPHQGSPVVRFLSFGDDWTSSLFMSQDPLAIDSVGLDFLRNEPRAPDVRGSVDNYLHEAALADKPPSGTVYDPEKDGKPLTSLGVHEHWNNPVAKQYSRNLGKAEGIELIVLSKSSRVKSSPKSTD
jgi:uncharacterized protein (DUF362 family)